MLLKAAVTDPPGTIEVGEAERVVLDGGGGGLGGGGGGGKPDGVETIKSTVLDSSFGLIPEAGLITVIMYDLSSFKLMYFAGIVEVSLPGFIGS